MPLSEETRRRLFAKRRGREAERRRIAEELGGDPFAGLVDPPPDERGGRDEDPQRGHDRLSGL